MTHKSRLHTKLLSDEITFCCGSQAVLSRVGHSYYKLRT